MVISRAMTLCLCQFGLFVLICTAVRNTGSLLFPCQPNVSSVDLGCLLEWDCPEVTPNVTYTVQTYTQGTREWQNVSGCVRISSLRCDLSQVFTDFDLYNSIRLGVDQRLGDPLWSDSLPCEPLRDSSARFSAPSLNVSLDVENLSVEVHFPCAPAVACTDGSAELQSCCPVSLFHYASITVTLYNKHNLLDVQTHTEEADIRGDPFRWKFWDLTPGQEYCAVANFTSSPPSLHSCVRLPSRTSDEWLPVFVPVVLGVGTGVCAVLIALTVLYLLKTHRKSSQFNLPKILESLQQQACQGFGGSSEVTKHADDDSVDDSLSIVSLPSGVLTETSAQPCPQSPGHGYYANPLPEDSGAGEGLESGWPQPCHPEPRRASELRAGPSLRPRGTLLPAALPPLQQGPGVPLSSVQLGGCEGEEGWSHIPAERATPSGSGLSSHDEKPLDRPGTEEDLGTRVMLFYSTDP